MKEFLKSDWRNVFLRQFFSVSVIFMLKNEPKKLGFDKSEFWWENKYIPGGVASDGCRMGVLIGVVWSWTLGPGELLSDSVAACK